MNTDTQKNGQVNISKEHKVAADHHELAAKHHKEAAKSYDAGTPEVAGHQANIAHGHTLNALDHSEDAIKAHADKNAPLKKV